jgi:hypothetical protein
MLYGRPAKILHTTGSTLYFDSVTQAASLEERQNVLLNAALKINCVLYRVHHKTPAKIHEVIKWLF